MRKVLTPGRLEILKAIGDRRPENVPEFRSVEVIACIGDRGFGVRRENMRKENALLVFPTDARCDIEQGSA